MFWQLRSSFGEFLVNQRRLRYAGPVMGYSVISLLALSFNRHLKENRAVASSIHVGFLPSGIIKYTLIWPIITETMAGCQRFNLYMMTAAVINIAGVVIIAK